MYNQYYNSNAMVVQNSNSIAQPQSEANFVSSEVKNKVLSIHFLHAFSHFIYFILNQVGVIEL